MTTTRERATDEARAEYGERPSHTLALLVFDAILAELRDRPAARTEEAYVPKVGDVVRVPRPRSCEGAQWLIVEVGPGNGCRFVWLQPGKDGKSYAGRDWSNIVCEYLRPTSLAERLAAGLDAEKGEAKPSSAGEESATRKPTCPGRGKCHRPDHFTALKGCIPDCVDGCASCTPGWPLLGPTCAEGPKGAERYEAFAVPGGGGTLPWAVGWVNGAGMLTRCYTKADAEKVAAALNAYPAGS